MASSTPLQQAKELLHAGDPDGALAALYHALWGGIKDPELHLFLWEVLEAKRLEQERLERLRSVVDNPITRPSGPIGPPIPQPPFQQAEPFTRPRQAQRYLVDRSIILVGYDLRNRFFAELAKLEETSLKGATVVAHRDVRIRDQVHLFSTSGRDDEFVVALVRNCRDLKENDQRRIGVEFLQKPGDWLLPDEILEAHDETS